MPIQWERSTLDLVQELGAEASKFSFALLVVTFEKSSSFVSSKEGTTKEKLARLNALVTEGGEPIGLVGIVIDDGGHRLTVYSRLLEEYASFEWARSYLDTLIKQFEVLLYKEYPASIITERPGWIN
jgi:hypothetical protein